jgi:hypothetical protein
MSQNTKREDLTVNSQWSSRPDDQRFATIEDLYAAVSARRLRSKSSTVALELCNVQVGGSGDHDLFLTGPRGGSAKLNHFSFGQLCSRASAPAAYLRKLPATLAAVNLQWSLEHAEAKRDDAGNDAKLLVQQSDDGNFLNAITSATYGRIWDAEVVDAIRSHVDLDAWKVPGASYASEDPLRATTLYASDRDVFIFLVNESNDISVAGEHLKRGFYVWNSEVGNSTFGLATFTYDYVCDNRIIWGQTNFSQLVIRHTSGGPDRFLRGFQPQLRAYAEASTQAQVEAIKVAKAYEVAKDRDGVYKWLRDRGFTLPVARAAYAAAETDRRNYNPRTVWGLVQGITDYAHDIGHTDARVDLEERAGKLLEVVAK